MPYLRLQADLFIKNIVKTQSKLILKLYLLFHWKILLSNGLLAIEPRIINGTAAMTIQSPENRNINKNQLTNLNCDQIYRRKIYKDNCTLLLLIHKSLIIIRNNIGEVNPQNVNI